MEETRITNTQEPIHRGADQPGSDGQSTVGQSTVGQSAVRHSTVRQSPVRQSPVRQSAARQGASRPEFEITEGLEGSVRYLEHGYPCPLCLLYTSDAADE